MSSNARLGLAAFMVLPVAPHAAPRQDTVTGAFEGTVLAVTLLGPLLFSTDATAALIAGRQDRLV